ncbi:unnamed protein product [Pleuronectes platessa]|uniref:Uncharacterized protein n=1 Tax=Pleuronectes platessa TaxID=8262 RepID=A0A9N7UCF0_PLEPL|nr:unnamed protein product [Pleuronectes platessa]
MRSHSCYSTRCYAHNPLPSLCCLARVHSVNSFRLHYPAAPSQSLKAPLHPRACQHLDTNTMAKGNGVMAPSSTEEPHFIGLLAFYNPTGA